MPEIIDNFCNAGITQYLINLKISAPAADVNFHDRSCLEYSYSIKMSLRNLQPSMLQPNTYSNRQPRPTSNQETFPGFKVSKIQISILPLTTSILYLIKSEAAVAKFEKFPLH